MNITVQQFNDVVTGANTHRLLLQAQVNEKIAEIGRLQEGFRAVQVENMRLANRSDGCEVFIRQMCEYIAGQRCGPPNSDGIPYGEQLLAEVGLLEDKAYGKRKKQVRRKA